MSFVHIQLSYCFFFVCVHAVYIHIMLLVVIDQIFLGYNLNIYIFI